MSKIEVRWLAKLFAIVFFHFFGLSEANAQQNDTLKIDSLYLKGKSLRGKNRDSSLFYIKQVEILSKKYNYKRGLAYALYEYGLQEKVLYNQFNYFTQSLELFESVHDKFGTSLNLIRIGSIYHQIGQSEKALDYSKKALLVKKEINDFGGTALALIQIGRYYKNKSALEEALKYFEESLSYRLKEGSDQGIAYAQINIAEVFFAQKKLDQVIGMCDSAYQKFYLTKDLMGQLWAHDLKGKSLLTLNKFEEAEKVFQSIVYFPHQVQHSDYLLHAKYELIKMLSARGDIRNAFKLQSEYLILKDSLAKWDYRSTTQKFVNEYEFKIAEKEAKRQKEVEEKQYLRRNNIEYLAITIFVLSLFIILYSGRKLFNAHIINSFLFVVLLLLFEFLLIVTDPVTESLTQGEPYLKLIANIVLAFLILPTHQFLEKRLKKRFIEGQA